MYDGVFSGARLADLLAWIDEYLASGGGAVHSTSNSAAVASAIAAVAAAQSTGGSGSGSGSSNGKQEASMPSAGLSAEIDGCDDDDDEQRGFAIVPKTDCPHLAQCLGNVDADAFTDAKRAFSSLTSFVSYIFRM